MITWRREKKKHTSTHSHSHTRTYTAGRSGCAKRRRLCEEKEHSLTKVENSLFSCHFFTFCSSSSSLARSRLSHYLSFPFCSVGEKERERKGQKKANKRNPGDTTHWIHLSRRPHAHTHTHTHTHTHSITRAHIYIHCASPVCIALLQRNGFCSARGRLCPRPSRRREGHPEREHRQGVCVYVCMCVCVYVCVFLFLSFLTSPNLIYFSLSSRTYFPFPLFLSSLSLPRFSLWVSSLRPYPSLHLTHLSWTNSRKIKRRKKERKKDCKKRLSLCRPTHPLPLSPLQHFGFEHLSAGDLLRAER